MFKKYWFTAAYSGQAKLWKVFWFGYIGSLIPLTILLKLAKEIYIKSPESLFPYATFVFSWFLYAWLAIALWRCSKNSSNNIFMLLGRVLACTLGASIFSALHMMIELTQF